MNNMNHLGFLQADFFFEEGRQNREFSGDPGTCTLDFYLSGRRIAGLKNFSETTTRNGCAPICDSLHPANFRADA